MNKLIDDDKYVLTFFFLEGCGPCKDMKKTWLKIPDEIEKLNIDNVVVAEVDQVYFNRINNAGPECAGFPCVKLINKDK